MLQIIFLSFTLAQTSAPQKGLGSRSAVSTSPTLSASKKTQRLIQTRRTLKYGKAFASSDNSGGADGKSSTTLNTEPKPLRDQLSGTVSAGVSLTDRSSNLEHSQGSSISLKLDLNFQPKPYFRFKIAPRFSAINGYTETIDPSATPENSFYFQTATGELISKYWNTTLAGGVIDLSAVHSALLFDDRGFPGIRLSTEPLSKGDASLKLYAEGAIPTSKTLVVEERSSTESPAFYSGGMLASYMGFSGRLGIFSFENLPNSAAAKSEYRGNEVESLSDTERTFPYEFKGWEASISADVTPNYVVSPEFNGHFVVNNEGLEDSNQALLGQVGLRFRTPWFDVVPYYTAYRTEANALPSVYMGAVKGLNYIGYRVGVETRVKDVFTLVFFGGEDEVIKPNPAFQSPGSTLGFKIGTGNVKF